MKFVTARIIVLYSHLWWIGQIEQVLAVRITDFHFVRPEDLNDNARTRALAKVLHLSEIEPRILVLYPPNRLLLSADLHPYFAIV